MRIIVVGAGVIGLSVAWHAREGGAEVVVVDPSPGHGASHAAGGMLTPVGESWHGEEPLVRLLADSSARYPAWVEAIGGATGYRTTSTLMAAADAADGETLDGVARMAVELGLDAEVLTTRAARRHEPALAPSIHSAVLAAHDHQVDPRALCGRLVEALSERGVEFVAAEVDRLDADNRAVVTDHGEHLHADAVVLANSIDASRLWPTLAGLRPVYGDMLRLGVDQRGHHLLQGVVRGHVHGRNVYLIPRGDGTVLLGASMREDADPRVNAGAVYDLLRDAVRLVPGVVDLALVETLARARPGTPDNLPLLGLLAPGVVAATGFHRHGVLLAPLAGAAVADLLGLASAQPPLPDLASCRPTRFHKD